MAADERIGSFGIGSLLVRISENVVAMAVDGFLPQPINTEAHYPILVW